MKIYKIRVFEKQTLLKKHCLKINPVTVCHYPMIKDVNILSINILSQLMAKILTSHNICSYFVRAKSKFNTFNDNLKIKKCNQI